MFVIANKEKDLFINEQIRAKEVMVIGPNGEQLGIKSKDEALTLASYAGFDLVLISPGANPPVCKIMDYNKYRYEKQKKEMADLFRSLPENIQAILKYETDKYEKLLTSMRDRIEELENTVSDLESEIENLKEKDE